MFSKIDRKILLILLASLVIIVAIIFIIYKYVSLPIVTVENSAGGAQNEQGVIDNNTVPENTSGIDTPSAKIDAGGVGATGTSGEGVLSICLDMCGDGVCQETDPNCGKPDNDLNCICAESVQECPQDCK